MKNSTPFKMLLLLCGLTLLFLSQGCLGIVQFLAPDSANAGQTINTLVRVKPFNTGESRVRVDYYLSSDHFYDKEDVLLQTAESFLASGDRYVDVNASFSLPGNLNSGEYFLLAVAYESETVWIYNEGQNVFHRKIDIFGTANDRPDLMFADVYLIKNAAHYYQPPSYFPGSTVATTLSLENKGPVYGAIYVTVRYYLSRSATFSLTDPTLSLMNEDVISSIGPNERLELTNSFIVPNVATYGLYYQHIIADYWNSTQETNEDNNLVTKMFYINQKREDHYIRSLDSPGLVLTGQPFPVVYEEGINQRIGSYASQVGIYLSTDATYGNGEELIFSTSTSNSGTANTYVRNRSIVIPPNTPTGSYYLIARINHLNSVPENDRTNNDKAIRVFVISSTNLTGDDICEEVSNSLQESDEEHLEKVSNLSRNQGTTVANLEMSVYPNPATETVNLDAVFKKDITSLHLEVINSEGKVLHTLDAKNVPGGNWSQQVDVRMLPAGTYFIRVISDQEVNTRALVVK